MVRMILEPLTATNSFVIGMPPPAKKCAPNLKRHCRIGYRACYQRDKPSNSMLK